jgi:uncharacterized membrane protein YjgN (DUF898 family)
MSTSDAPGASAEDATQALAFSGSRGAFFGLVVRGAMLELVTVGFYRFWLATDVRRHLWSNTSAGGDAAEYTGRPVELLIGFLFALAVMIPLYLVLFFVDIEAERMRAFLSIPLLLIYYPLAQFAIYRARRYRLTRTVWRGVRFWMAGSGWSYAWRASLWSLLAVVTLGLAMPWRLAALERFKMRHTFYGELAGRFDGTGAQFFRRAGLLWLIAVAFIIMIGALAGRAPLFSGLLVVTALVGAPFVYAIYKAMEWRWWCSNIRLGDVRFESRMPASELIDLYWKVILFGLFLLVCLISGLTALILIAQRIEATDASFQPEAIIAAAQRPWVIVMTAIMYVCAALAAGIVVRVYLIRDIWKRVVEWTVVHNLAAADNVAARGELAGALGEGLADSLDVGGL